MAGTKSLVYFLKYTADCGGAPRKPTGCWCRVSDTNFVPVYIFIIKKKSQYIFMSMLSKNTYLLLLLSDLADYK